MEQLNTVKTWRSNVELEPGTIRPIKSKAEGYCKYLVLGTVRNVPGGSRSLSIPNVENFLDSL